jgi:two-component system response regulator YesN
MIKKYVELEEYDLYKVLLVDDDKSILCGLRQFKEWESCGFTIEGEACASKAALDKLVEKCFDLVITDIRMPGMDGLELLNKLKARNLDTCLMIMSTYNDFEYAQEGIRLGAFDYITKPMDGKILESALTRVKRHLDEKNFLQKRRKEEKQILFEENLRFFYPTSQEQKLIDLMMIGDYKVIDEASSTCLELFNLTNQDLVKTGILLGKMLLNLKEKINHNFPWLVTLEEIVFNDTLTEVEYIDGIKTKFLSCINTMLEIIKKYELHRPDSIVGKTCRYVIEHVEDNITLEDIASVVHIGKDYLGKLFKQKTGYNFIDYATKVKMEHAKYLIVTGEYKNYELSEKLSYSSTDYFCRLFKGYTGFTPVEFRRIGS